jgi:hypothetical protein
MVDANAVRCGFGGQARQNGRPIVIVKTAENPRQRHLQHTQVSPMKTFNGSALRQLFTHHR